MIPEFFNDPGFLSSLILAALFGWLHWRINRLQTIIIHVREESLAIGKAAEDILKQHETTSSYFFNQSDISIHHGFELTRLRESVLELASDAERLSQLQYITTLASFPGEQASEVIARIFSDVKGEPDGWEGRLALASRVFNRHTELPDELPEETKALHRHEWVCPFCSTRMADNWAGWCTTCRRRTFGLAQARNETFPPPDHEPTSPSSMSDDEFACFACDKLFPLTQHPLMAVCPHCGARQTDVALDFERIS